MTQCAILLVHRVASPPRGRHSTPRHQRGDDLRRPRHGLYEPSTEHDACGMGFVAHIKGEKSRDIIEDGLELLKRLAHRGACGCDPETGDGAGILVQIPHRFFKAEGLKLGFAMPRRRRYAIGQVFLPPDPEQRRACERLLEEAIAEAGQRLIGWRDVPIDASQVGRIARRVLPTIRQVYVAMVRVPPSAFERRLYVIRKLAENRIRESGADPDGYFHVPSLSAETIVYKGLLLPRQLPEFYADLRASNFVSAIALVHSRFSTNTFPTWDLAQPFRHICHNGEINTLRGNRNWMQARRSQMQSAKFGGSLDRLFPIIVPGGSDSAQFDNMVELLHLGGRSLPHALAMMIPEAWEDNAVMDPDRSAFYEYSSALMEPWDGPAAIAFTDGHVVGATLDRNGLRPARYIVTTDDRVILSSETGVIDVPPEQIREKGRLRPGRIFVVDTEEGRIIDDSEMKHELSSRFPYRKWLQKNQVRLADCPKVAALPAPHPDMLVRLQRAFGYTDEDVNVILTPMAEAGEEPLGSMGTDTPLACLSDRAPILFDYFKQLFAQVTNPPIDPIRESLVMSTRMAMGMGGNPFDETPEQCHYLGLESPIMTNEEMERIRAVEVGVFETSTLSLLYEPSGPDALAAAVAGLCDAAVAAIDDGNNILILSDRGVDARHLAIPSLLAVSAVHQRLVREGTRMLTGLCVETAEAREVHHFAALIGFGAAAVNPYLAIDTVRQLAESGLIEVTPEKAERNFLKAISKGLLKVMSKMGISTLISYCGAQIFEAIGLDADLVEEHFTGTPSRIGGVGLRELGEEVATRHRRGFAWLPELDYETLPTGGIYQWRRRGEAHKWNPATIAKLQAATRQNDRALFDEFSVLADDETEQAFSIRGLLALDIGGAPAVPLSEVEPVESILSRFCTGAMSFGSISAAAHETLAVAMNRIGGRSNSGEGGEERERFVADPNGDRRISEIKQIASGRFGVHTEYLVNASDLQIKMAQGAKPGEGGQLPGHKVSERIAAVRCSTPGVTLISPPPHHDIYSIEDLAQLIHDLKTVNERARVSVKLVSEVGVGTIAAGVAKARADAVIIAGESGGTGASPISSIKHAGVPWELGLAEAQQVLVQNSLRGRVRVQVDGGMRTGRDVVVAALLGAEEFGFATAPLVVSGCIMLRRCHQNTCSVGIATQDPELVERYDGDPQHVVNYFTFIAESVREQMAALGFRTLDEMVGRVERLRPRTDVEHWKARLVDLSPLLVVPNADEDEPRYCIEEQDHQLALHLDRTLLERARPAIDEQGPVDFACRIANTDRAVGAMLAGEIARRYGSRGLADDSIIVRFDGTAGQSFGAFLTRGVTFAIEGDCNDYVGKGLSGGKLIVAPPTAATFAPEDNVIVGNTTLYGATGGELYVNGIAGERFAVRNSGARAVVEGVGDHGCEYMTGGVVVVLGATGRNFAAGMSGGMAFVYDAEGDLRRRCNMDMVELESLIDRSDIWLVHGMIEDHVRYTGSPLGQRLLDNWEILVSRFVKVMPTEYKRVLQKRRSAARNRMTTGTFSRVPTEAIDG
ncbi:MAG: glutamate synthase large subunit [Myxococcales bacterium]|nr:glutamate synthase large subunit [Myxococcales bacterium]MCB9530815.1 glutamate synthase large subunit [Myxococcales bacterium]